MLPSKSILGAKKNAHRIIGNGIFTCMNACFFGKLVGTFTNPMDPLRNHQPILRDFLWFCCSFNTGPSCFFPQRTRSPRFHRSHWYAAPIVVMIISWETWHWGGPRLLRCLWICVLKFAGMTSKQHPLWTASCFLMGIRGCQGMCISNLFTRRIIWKRFKRCYLVNQKKGGKIPN